MARAAILLAFIAVAGVVLNVVVGSTTGLGWTTIRFHFNVAIPSTVAILFVWTVVVFYFIGACAWVRDSVDHGGSHPSFLERAVALRRLGLTWPIVAALVLSVAYILGGAAHSGSASWLLHLVAAVVTLLAHAVAFYRTVVLVGMMLDLQGAVGPSAPETSSAPS